MSDGVMVVLVALFCSVLLLLLMPFVVIVFEDVIKWLGGCYTSYLDFVIERFG